MRRIDFLQNADCGERVYPKNVPRRTEPDKKESAHKPAEQRLFPSAAIQFGDGFGQQNVHWQA
jgi:hypothetical protein